MKNIEREIKVFKFRNGDEVKLQEPTLLQIQNAQMRGKGDDIEISKNLLIDMSNGELDKEFINSLPIAEFKRLSECVAEFVGLNGAD